MDSRVALKLIQSCWVDARVALKLIQSYWVDARVAFTRKLVTGFVVGGGTCDLLFSNATGICDISSSIATGTCDLSSFRLVSILVSLFPGCSVFGLQVCIPIDSPVLHLSSFVPVLINCDSLMAF